METIKGTARLAAQDGGTGYFASVELEAEIHEGERLLTVEFKTQGAEQWKEAAIVGVRTAWKPRLVTSHNRQPISNEYSFVGLCWI